MNPETFRSLKHPGSMQLQIWMSILVACIMVAVVLFVVARFSPYERIRNPENFSLGNSFWFVIAGLLLRSPSSIQPRVSLPAA